jgi:hypothetical protein
MTTPFKVYRIWDNTLKTYHRNGGRKTDLYKSEQWARNALLKLQNSPTFGTHELEIHEFDVTYNRTI